MAKAKLAKVSVEDLKKEICRRQAALPNLIAERDALSCQIAELEGLGGVKPTAVARHRKAGRRKAGRRAGRPAVVKAARAGTLSSALVEVLGAKGKLTAPEAAAAVLATGYKSTSKAFPKVVRLTLLKGKQFKRVSRGVYALKPTAAGQKTVSMAKAAPAGVKPPRAGSLSSALIRALEANGKLSVAQAAAAVEAGGYKSKSKDFGNIVSMMLSKDKRFRRVSRGVYALKG